MAILSITEISEVKMVRLYFLNFSVIFISSFSFFQSWFVNIEGWRVETMFFLFFCHIPRFICIEYFLRLIEKLLLRILGLC